MKMDISLSSIKQHTARLLSRYHVIIFVVVALGGLAVAMFVLNNIIVASAKDTTYTPELSSSFDEETIERVEKLRSRNELSQPLDLSQGRTNPFVE